MSGLRVLIVDDEPAIRQILVSQVRRAGYEVESAEDGASALKQLDAGDVDVCICDLRLPDIDGVEIMRRARQAGVNSTFLMMTAYASVETAIEAMRLGAFDYLTKPLRGSDVLHRLSQIENMIGLEAENRRLKALVDEQQGEYFRSGSGPMVEVERLAAKVAPTAGTVLITGASGTGKSLIARRIHEQSPQRERAFLSVNCGAIAENLIESEFFGHVKGAFTGADKAKKGLFCEAHEGTLLLDEVCELPLPLQVKLLHVLEEKEVRAVGSERTRAVDVRILSATNRNVEQMVADGQFREDLYYRLNVLRITMPPLKDRVEDLPQIIRFFLGRESSRLGLKHTFELDPLAEEVLLAHDWPGNLRELQNMIARALVMADGDSVTIRDLPRLVGVREREKEEAVSRSEPSGNLRDRVRDFEVTQIRQALAASGGDRQVAAGELGIGLSTLYRKLEESEGGVGRV
ncbi:MAG: sigma-54-dependent Fis family transcriptional regulator [Deltaproteobacteria bacterium]|nr:sigma-54-dependent Fis family transcriptional regulator [Deltaproteobacteria bacterium]